LNHCVQLVQEINGKLCLQIRIFVPLHLTLPYLVPQQTARFPCILEGYTSETRSMVTMTP